MPTHNQINYIEMPAKDILGTKKFFRDVFGWEFVDYGPDYISFNNEGVDGGFFKSDLTASTITGSVLVVLYSSELENTQSKVIASGGTIIKPIYEFPGGRRFHFTDPNGNEFAVWSE
ncbi:MAG TPA: VOC family protein [Anaerolineales bacterium]|nr:VOC family protein [Anaerolineales bacterium]